MELIKLLSNLVVQITILALIWILNAKLLAVPAMI
jgi:hypothetical protein